MTFPPLTEPGTFEGSDRTRLRVASTSPGWGLSQTLDLSIPSGASEAAVTNALSVTYDPYETVAGSVEVDVSYTLRVAEEDFAGLPEGAYVIQITFTASTD